MFNRIYDSITMDIIAKAKKNKDLVTSIDVLIAIKESTDFLPFDLKISLIDNPVQVYPNDQFNFIISKILTYNNNKMISVQDILYVLSTDVDFYSEAVLKASLKSSKLKFTTFIEKLKVRPVESNNLKTLSQFSTNLTQQAREHKLDPVIGRTKELVALIQVLTRRNKNNPCILGEPGVGKSVLVNELARKIVNKEVPTKLLDKEIYMLDVSNIVGGTKYRGDFEQRIKDIFREVKDAGNIILFIDELHSIIGAGSADGSTDLSNIIKPLLSRGEIQVIGATTFEEYKKTIEQRSALERRFHKVIIEESTIDETIQILKGIKFQFELFYNCVIEEEALIAAAQLSAKYIPYRKLPDKAIDALDEAISRKRIGNTTFESNKDIKETLLKENEQALLNNDFPKSIEIRNKLEAFKTSFNHFESQEVLTINTNDIAELISIWSGVPVSKLTETEMHKLMNIEDKLHESVIGQQMAITSLAKAIRRNRAGFRNVNRPIGSFIFIGTSGVGKTELAKSLANLMFDSKDAMIRIDMSEYMEKHSVSKMVGSPPGYVGYEESGQLTEKIRLKPYSIILFDEIEKAHPDVFNLLLQILDDGHITDSKGRIVDFKNTIIIMTSNIGTHKLTSNVGFNATGLSVMQSDITKELKNFFRPEFLNRIDEIIFFDKLSKEDCLQIIDIMLKPIVEASNKKSISISITDSVKDNILDKGFDKEYGARPLRRYIQNTIEDKLAEAYISGKISDNSSIIFDLIDGEIQITDASSVG